MVALRAQYGLSGPGAEERTSWAQLAKVGEFAGHPAGEFTITPEDLKAVVECFEAQTNPIVVDREHASTLEGMEAPAAGWIQRLEIRPSDDGDQLWGVVEWTERGAEQVRSGEYRFTSPVLIFDAPMRDSGEEWPCRMHSAALTNCPFLDGMAAVTLSDRVLRSIAPTNASARALAEGKRMPINRKTILDAAKAAPTEAMSAEAWAKWIEAYLAAIPGDEPDEPDADDDTEEPVGEPPPVMSASDKARGGGTMRKRMRVTLADGASGLLQQIAGMLKVDATGDDLFGAIYGAITALENAAKVETMLSAAPAAAMSDDAKKLVRNLRALSETGAEVSMAEVDATPPTTTAPAEAATCFARLAEATGIHDAAALMAAVETNIAAVAAAITGGTMASNDSSKEVAQLTAALSDTRKALETAHGRIAVLEPTVKELSEERAKREAAGRESARSVRMSQVDLLVKSKQIPETARAAFVALGDKDADAFGEQLKSFRLDLEGVPLGRIASAQADPRAGREFAPDDPTYRALSERWDGMLKPIPGETPESRKKRVDAAVSRSLAAQGGS